MNSTLPFHSSASAACFVSMGAGGDIALHQKHALADCEAPRCWNIGISQFYRSRCTRCHIDVSCTAPNCDDKAILKCGLLIGLQVVMRFRKVEMLAEPATEECAPARLHHAKDAWFLLMRKIPDSGCCPDLARNVQFLCESRRQARYFMP